MRGGVYALRYLVNVGAPHLVLAVYKGVKGQAKAAWHVPTAQLWPGLGISAEKPGHDDNGACEGVRNGW